MIQEGMIEKGIELIQAVRDRYDGYRRNPWNEIECGSNYARSMASYAALLAFSGFQFDMPKKKLGFNPIVDGNFSCFWSIDSGWGTFEKTGTGNVLKLLYGTLTLSCLKLKYIKPTSVLHIGKNGTIKNVNFSLEDQDIIFQPEITLNAGEEIKITGEMI